MREFFKLKLIKTYLRWRISQEILSNLPMLSTENGISKILDFKVILKKFANKIISVQLRNALTSLDTETFSGIYPFQLHYSFTLQHHYIITILFK